MDVGGLGRWPQRETDHLPKQPASIRGWTSSSGYPRFPGDTEAKSSGEGTVVRTVGGRGEGRVSGDQALPRHR